MTEIRDQTSADANPISQGDKMYRWHGYPPHYPYQGPYYGANYGPQYGNGYAQPNGQQVSYPAQAEAEAPSGGLLPLSSDSFIKGALIGAAAAYILTNENVQHSMIKGSVKAWSLLQGGVEEIKERFRDAEAEIMAEQSIDE